jgi:hypothetical protein
MIRPFPFPFRPRVAVIVPGSTRLLPITPALRDVTRNPELAVPGARRPSTVAQLRRRIRARIARGG